jgi:hypothetical protein
MPHFWNEWGVYMTRRRSKVRSPDPSSHYDRVIEFHHIDGRFGAMMSVGLTNEGPMTFILDSRSDEASLGTNSGASTPASSGGSKVNKGAQRGAEKALRRAAWESAKSAPSKVNTEQERSRTEDEVAPENAAQTPPSHDNNTAGNEITH